MKLTKPTGLIAFTMTAGDDWPRLNLKGLTCEPVMSTGMRARMATMPIRRNKHRKPMMDQRRMSRTVA